MAMVQTMTIFMICSLFTMLGNHALRSSGLTMEEHFTPARNLERLQLPRNRIGPTIVNFDSQGVLYAGVRNGKILKYLGPSTGFVDFAYTIANSSKQQCDDVTGTKLEPVCGRPARMSFYQKTGDLYFTDAYYALRSVGPNGGVSSQVAGSVEGVRFNFLAGIYVDNDDDTIYFTETSTVYGKNRVEDAIRNNDKFGILMKYDIPSKQITILLRGLSWPAGVVLSKDKNFLLFTEFVGKKIRKYWLKGPKANTTETVVTLPGRPTNIKINSNGQFWVAVVGSDMQDAVIPLGYLLSEDGTTVLKVLDFRAVNVTSSLNEVNEYKSKLYVSSQYLDYVGVLSIEDQSITA